MELTALQVGIRLDHHIKRTLTIINITKQEIESNNEAVLQWIRNNNNTNHPPV